MPSGAVIRYEGKRGRVWRIKYSDASGRQVMETIGAERAGVTRKTAEAELRDRLVKVEKGRWRGCLRKRKRLLIPPQVDSRKFWSRDFDEHRFFRRRRIPLPGGCCPP
jgi:hypothetical protein